MYDKAQDPTTTPVLGERKLKFKNAILFTLFISSLVILFFTLRDFIVADFWDDLSAVTMPFNSEDPIFGDDYIMQHYRMKSYFLSRIKILSIFCM
jgi:K+-transporting ATPase c subunit